MESAALVAALLLSVPEAAPSDRVRLVIEPRDLPVQVADSPCRFGMYGTSIRSTPAGPRPRSGGRSLVVDCGPYGAWNTRAAVVELLFDGTGRGFFALTRDCKYCDSPRALRTTLYEGRIRDGQLEVHAVSGVPTAGGRLGRLASGALVFFGDQFRVHWPDGRRCHVPREALRGVEALRGTCADLTAVELASAQFLASPY